MISSKRIFPAIFILLVLSSCEKKPIPWFPQPRFVPYDCEMIDLRASKMDDPWGILKQEESVRADSLSLRIWVLPSESKTASGFDERYFASPDKDIEELILWYIEECMGAVINHESQPNHIEYRKEVCRNLTIVSDKPLFGQPAGADLSPRFEFLLLGNDYRSLIIDENKRLIGPIKDGMSVEEFLSYRPFVIPLTYLHPKGIPEEAPIHVKFTVTMELDGGKTLSGSTSVSLTK